MRNHFIIFQRNVINKFVTVGASLRFKLLSHHLSYETSLHVSACEILTEWRHTFFKVSQRELDVCLWVGFGGDAGRMFTLCHTLKGLVRTCQNRCLKLRSPLFTMAFSCSGSLIHIKPHVPSCFIYMMSMSYLSLVHFFHSNLTCSHF